MFKSALPPAPASHTKRTETTNSYPPHPSRQPFFHGRGWGKASLKTRRRKKKGNQQRQTGDTLLRIGRQPPHQSRVARRGPVPDTEITERWCRHAPALCATLRSRNAPRRPPRDGRDGADLGRGRGAGPGQRGAGLKTPTSGSLHRSGRSRTQAWPVRHSRDRLCGEAPDEGSAGLGSCRAAAVRPGPGRPKGAAGEQDTRAASSPVPPAWREKLTSPRPAP